MALSRKLMQIFTLTSSPSVLQTQIQLESRDMRLLAPRSESTRSACSSCGPSNKKELVLAKKQILSGNLVRLKWKSNASARKKLISSCAENWILKVQTLFLGGVRYRPLGAK